MAKKEQSEESMLETAAKTLGKAAGKVAAATGVSAGDAPSAPRKEKVGKLVKKNKTRLPRREKKALQKAAAKKQAV